MKQNYINTNNSHNEIHWKDGTVCKQLTPFAWWTADWNNDGDIYQEYGAMFETKYGGKEFYFKWRLEDLVDSGEAIIKDGAFKFELFTHKRFCDGKLGYIEVFANFGNHASRISCIYTFTNDEWHFDYEKNCYLTEEEKTGFENWFITSA